MDKGARNSMNSEIQTWCPNTNNSTFINFLIRILASRMPEYIILVMCDIAEANEGIQAIRNSVANRP